MLVHSLEAFCHHVTTSRGHGPSITRRKTKRPSWTFLPLLGPFGAGDRLRTSADDLWNPRAADPAADVEGRPCLQRSASLGGQVGSRAPRTPRTVRPASKRRMAGRGPDNARVGPQREGRSSDQRCADLFWHPPPTPDALCACADDAVIGCRSCWTV